MRKKHVKLLLLVLVWFAFTSMHFTQSSGFFQWSNIYFSKENTDAGYFVKKFRGDYPLWKQAARCEEYYVMPVIDMLYAGGMIAAYLLIILKNNRSSKPNNKQQSSDSHRYLGTYNYFYRR